MLRRWNWLVIMMVVLIPFVGCSDDDESVLIPTPPIEDSAFDVMAAAAKAYINDNTQCPGVLAATALNDNLANYTVIDIRSQANYDLGHIPGAYHSSLGTLIADLATIPNDKPYVIACYSGQSAGHAKVAMELLGYGEVYSLLFGMSAWHSSLDKWSTKCSDNLMPAHLETTNNNSGLATQSFPTLSENVATVVAERVALMLQNGFKAKSYASIQDNLSNYFIVNYFGEADYLGTGTSGVPGHISGAFQFTPYASMGFDEMLKNIPADKEVIVYCWTGQHSSQVTAYLNMLGYDAYSMSNGSNNLFYGDLTAHKWGPGAMNDFMLETTP